MLAVQSPTTAQKNWYTLPVMTGKEDRVRKELERQSKIQNLEHLIGRVLCPTEKVTSVVRGKRVTRKVKKFPGYLFIEMERHDDAHQLFYRLKDTLGNLLGGFANPTPLSDKEVERLLALEASAQGEAEPKAGKFDLGFGVGEFVRITDGSFANMEGKVKQIDDPETDPKITVVVQIFGRPVPVLVQAWQAVPVE